MLQLFQLGRRKEESASIERTTTSQDRVINYSQCEKCFLSLFFINPIKKIFRQCISNEMSCHFTSKINLLQRAGLSSTVTVPMNRTSMFLKVVAFNLFKLFKFIFPRNQFPAPILMFLALVHTCIFFSENKLFYHYLHVTFAYVSFFKFTPGVND